MPWRNWVCFFVKFIHQGAFIKQHGLKYDLSKKTVLVLYDKTAKTRTIKIRILRMYMYEYVRTVYVYVVQVVRVRNSRSG